jgi:hypothetical protein
MDKLPPAEDGKTAIPPPEDHVLPGLMAQLAAGERGKAIRAAESNVNAYVYWLDLSRISAEALLGLGQAHDAARRALEGQMAGLIHRFPELPTLTFADGRPFADGATRQWLATLVAGQGGAEDPFLAELDEATANPPEKALAAIGNLLVAHPGDKYTLALYQAAFAACRKGSLWPPLPYLAIRLLDLTTLHRLPQYDAAATAEALAAAAEALAAALTANADTPEIRTQYARIAAELAGLWPHRLLGAGA